MLEEILRDELLQAALLARDAAYAPYSKFQVGAALQTQSGKIFSGCNVENASYGMTICAERTAAVSAVAAGERQFTALAIASNGAVTPCGACRQFLAEFAAELPILLLDPDAPQQVRQVQLANLLPDQFSR